MGLDALTYYLKKRPEGILPPNEVLLRLSEMILTMNFFKYLDSYYLQCRGIAMGSAFHLMLV